MTMIEHYLHTSVVLPKAEMAAYDPNAEHRAEPWRPAAGVPLRAAAYGFVGHCTGAGAGMTIAAISDWNIWQGATLAILLAAVLGSAFAATSLSRTGMPLRSAIMLAMLIALPANFWLLWRARSHVLVHARCD